jgi:hypothetical protein
MSSGNTGCSLSHQRLGQLDPDTLNAVLNNCRIKAVFGGLPATEARLMAEELFLNQVDPKKVKLEIRQTAFRPVYARDKDICAHEHHWIQHLAFGDGWKRERLLPWRRPRSWYQHDLPLPTTARVIGAVSPRPRAAPAFRC